MPRSPRPPSQRQYVTPPMPGFVEFLHPKLVAEPPATDRWLHELKFDGYRMQVRVAGGVATILSRNGNDWTARLPELAATAAAQMRDVILDGELVALGRNGQPDFSRLRASLSPGKTGALLYYAFDQMWSGQDDLRPYPLSARKTVLEQTLATVDQARIRRVQPLPQGGRAMLDAACELQLEGIVSKRLDSPYVAGRRETWVKAKCRPSQEVVVGGWVQEGATLDALLIGVYDGAGRLTYAGSLKNGFTAANTKGLFARLREIEVDVSPFAAGDPPRKKRNIHWARPELVAAAEIAEWTASGKLRQASFKGLREDKRPEEVVRETPAA